MKASIVLFPGTNRERDIAMALSGAGFAPPRIVWHRDDDLGAPDLVVLPGGFSYGDYLRSGAMAARSPAMAAVRRFAEGGGHVLGVCNGFQILTETGLLPGALLRNRGLRFLAQDCFLRVEHAGSPFTAAYRPGQVVRVPMAHGDGNYFADRETLAGIEAEGRVAFRYATPAGDLAEDANPNGSVNAIAGVLSPNRRVLGLMPHPENAADPLLGRDDGLGLFRSLLEAVA